MLLAASRQCWLTLRVLYFAGADLTEKDFEKSNYLHLAVKTGVDLSELWKCRKGVGNHEKNASVLEK